jgi:pyruvate ferredoxin oxidoreductase alpha subunit
MHEMLFVASGSRTPIVMAVANRALSAPLNINGDQSDSMAERDSGWIQVYAENAQEAYDTIIQAFKIAEDVDVSLPIIVGVDGFTLSHTLENVETLPDEMVKEFVGERILPKVLNTEGKLVPFKLDPANPITMGPIALPNYYFEFKRQQEEAMKNAFTVIQKVNDDYAKISGRSYGNGLIDAYKLEDAEVAIVVIGATAGTLKVIADEMRQGGLKVGVLRLKTFRPFPVEAIKTALENVSTIAVMDKAMSFGANGGPIFSEVRHAMYDAKKHPLIMNYIFGLGGRDTNPKDLRKIYEELLRVKKAGKAEKTVTYLGLRE